MRAQASRGVGTRQARVPAPQQKLEHETGAELLGARATGPEGLAGPLGRNTEHRWHYSAERRRGVEALARASNVGVIEDVEPFAENRQPVSFTEREGLRQAYVLGFECAAIE